MTETFFDENEPPGWVVLLARRKLAETGDHDPPERRLRLRAWELLQAMERDVVSRPP